MVPSKKRLSLKRKTASDQENDKREVPASKRIEQSVNTLPYCGLVNIGNTCYINATIQALRSCLQLTDSLQVHNTDQSCISTALFKLINEMSRSEGLINTAVTPLALVDMIQNTFPLFQLQSQQHDTQELLQCILLALKNAVAKQAQSVIITGFFNRSSVRIKNANCFSRMFEGTLQFETKCMNCEDFSRQTENFFNITIPVLPESTRRCGPISLYNAITEATSIDDLSGDNKYSCNSCQHLTEGRRVSLLARLPQIMIIHINRFSTALQLGNVHVHKILGNIATPTIISFKQWTTSNCNDRDAVYELSAVILHTGTCCTSGHYTTIVNKSNKSGGVSWVWFDDDNVSTITYNNVIELLSPLSTNECTPYILLYKKH